MKKDLFNYVFLPALLLILGAGCVSTQTRTGFVDESAAEPTATTQMNYGYQNKELGIALTFADDIDVTLTQDSGKIKVDSEGPYFGQYIWVFKKEVDESMEEAMRTLIASEGKNPDDCQIKEVEDSSNRRKYKIDLAEPITTYTTEQQAEIAAADAEAKADGGPFDGEWKKGEIYNQTSIERCSQFADRLGLGTSKSLPSIFLNNPSISQTTFVFLPGSSNRTFYGDGTGVEFLSTGPSAQLP